MLSLCQRIAFLVLSVLIATPLVLTAQAPCSYGLSGRVIDLDDGRELDGTFVILTNADQTQITNQHGIFKFTGLCAGSHTLLIRHVGCRDTLIGVHLKKDLKLTIRLPHSAIELGEIDVMDKQPDMIRSQTVNELKDADLDRTRGQSLGESLKLISGVTTLNTGSTISKPMIHGMQGYRVLILNNGIRQEGQQWGNEHAPEIDPFIASKLSVIKGANAVRYGSDAMAGVILVEPAELPDTASVTGEVNLVGMSNGQSGTASGILQGYFDQLKGLSWRAQGTYRKGGNIRTPQYYLKNTGVEEMNYSYTLGYHRKNIGLEAYYSQFNTKVGIFTGAHIGNLSDLKAAFASAKPQDSLASFSYDIGRPYQDVSHELAKAKLHIHLAPRWLLNAQYAYQYNIRQEFDKTPPRSTSYVDPNKPDLDYRITSQTAELVLEHLNIKSFRGQFGASYMNQKNVYLGRFFIPNFKNNTFGVFATERYVRQHLELEAGLRFDQKHLQSYYYTGNVLQSPDLQFRNISWNLGAIIKPTQTFHIFVNAGSAWRAPAPNELYSNGLHQGLGSIERGNPNLKTEQVYNLTVTGLYQTKNYAFELTAYHNQFSNFIYLNPGNQPELTIKGAYPVFNYMQADARISGLDGKASAVFFNSLEITAKSMLLRAWNYSIDDYLVYMPADRYSLDAKVFRRFSGVLQEAYIQGGYQYITKQWRVPDSTDFAPPPKAYGLLSAEIGSRFRFGKQQIVISMTATNLLNTVYRDYLDRFRYFADSQGRNFTLRLRVPFTAYDK